LRSLFFFILFFGNLLFSEGINPAAQEALLRSLDPLSIAEHLAFYELYPNSPHGRESLALAWKLLTHSEYKKEEAISLSAHAIQPEMQPLISFITQEPFRAPPKLGEKELLLIEKISSALGNRTLKGNSATKKEQILALPSEEIDLARAVLLYQFDTLDEVRSYEASLDLMALQISVRLKKNASPRDKIKEINRFIFQEMQFRFPPHSVYATDIDLYTFLPSVIDRRQGVCLGVSILYLALAQRLDLPLEIITPPGHIYIRHHQGEELINIETTARGIDLPCETYLGINTRKLEQRTLKEVIGMAFVNQASIFWGKEDYHKTIELYEKALLFLPEDPLVKMLLALNVLFLGKKEQGVKMLLPLRELLLDHAVSKETLPSDFLEGRVDEKGLQAIFLPVDEKRASILKKQELLKQTLKRFPSFRAGLLQLAVTYLQLNRKKEALATLETYHAIDPHDATVEYYLAALSLERSDLPKARLYLKNAEKITALRAHHPRVLQEMRREIRQLAPN
jgi:tetratricopeptide (TPR) repeat protein